jgi:DNA-binding FadR family transcriptional regulator
LASVAIPVREAVKSLEVLGILEARAGSGLFVKSFSFDAIINNLPYGLISDAKTVGPRGGTGLPNTDSSST